MIYFVMGVSGSGKTTLGKALAKALRIPFLDADDFHPIENIQKMAKGIPLSDTDRQPWLMSLHQAASRWKDQAGIIACSALKKQYRTLLSQGLPCRWIYLDGSFEEINHRLEKRKDHFMPPSLLRSQFQALEVPQLAIRVPVSWPIQKQIEYIMQQSNVNSFGLMGLGVMGTSLARNLAQKGISLSLFNREIPGVEEGIVEDRLHRFPELQVATGFTDIPSFVASLETPRKIFLMVPAGAATDELLKSISPYLQPGDILMDGGNTYFKDTKRRQAWFSSMGIHFVGIGVSGGEKGALEGPSIMPSGPWEAYLQIQPFLDQIAAKDFAGNPCCTYLGPGAAGHFVKMVHNGIEYAEMQLLAELFGVLTYTAGWSQGEIAQLFAEWTNTEAKSYLLEITTQILQFQQPDGSYLLPEILDEAGSKGTGGWTTQTAVELGVPSTIITAALMARFQSSYRENQIHWQEDISPKKEKSVDIQALFHAFQVARILNHHQGFSLIREAQRQYGWQIPFQELARIWTNGCIIRSQLMEDFSNKLQDFVLDIPETRNYVQQHLKDVSSLIELGLSGPFPLPCFSAAYQAAVQAFFHPPTAHLIQAQRDYFGAHTYQRRDDPNRNKIHTNWEI